MGATKYVYDFSEGNASMKPLLGGKGANLAEMTGLGIPVPPGFIVTTAACVYYSANGAYPEGLEAGDRGASQGSGEAHRQDPGRPQEPAASLHPFRRRVLHAGHDGHRAQPGPERRDGRGAGPGHRQPALRLRLLSAVHLHVRRRGHGGRPAGLRRRPDGQEGGSRGRPRHRPHRRRPARPHRSPQSAPGSACRRAVPGRSHEAAPPGHPAVFKSWDNHRAKVYRRTQGIPDDLGTAVNVQTMVFGNKGETSGTGVAFTRDPSTGENFFYGEFLMNAQGEDVVAGVRHPRPLEEMGEVMPEALKQLYDIRETLEKHYRDMQDLEFTIEDDEALHAADPQRQAHRAGRPAQWPSRWWPKASSARTRRSCGSTRASSTSCCTRGSIPKRSCTSWPPGWAPPRVPPWARRSSTPTRPKSAAPGASRSSWCAGRPTPTTSTGSSSPRASSPATAA